MPDQDALSQFDFSKVTGIGLFVKFEAGKPLTLRVLTVDPIVKTQEFVDEKTDEVKLSTKFAFVVYNFTDEKAQILSASPGIAKKFGDLHIDPDFGANIRELDIKITPTGEKLTRKYDIQVLPKARELTQEQIKECAKINLDEKVDGGDRMSFYAQQKPEPSEPLPTEPDTVADMTDEPINLDDIPF